MDKEFILEQINHSKKVIDYYDSKIVAINNCIKANRIEDKKNGCVSEETKSNMEERNWYYKRRISARKRLAYWEKRYSTIE